MLFSLLRDCARVGITVFCGAYDALATGKGVALDKVKSCMKDMGFVSREEFEALVEYLKHSQVGKQDKSLKRDKE